MYPDFLALAYYFGTFLHLAAQIGSNTYVIVQASLENAVMLKYLEMVINEHIGPNLNLNTEREVDWPTDGLVASFLSRIRMKDAKGFEKNLLLESIYFYKQCSQMSHSTVDEIATEVWEPKADRKPIPNSLKHRVYSSKGQMIDRFGFMLSQENLIANVSRRFAATQGFELTEMEDLNVDIQDMRIIDIFIDNFENQSDNAGVTDIPEYNEYVNYLRIAPINHIALLGLPADSFFFSNRKNSIESLPFGSEVLQNAAVKRFIAYLREQLEKDMPEEVDYEENVLHNKRSPKISQADLDSWLAANNFTKLVEELEEINKHPESALQLSKRLAEDHVVFVFGSENVPYPPFLIQTCFKVDKYDFLKSLSNDFLPGIKSVFKADSDGIFRAAFTNYLTTGSYDQLFFLIDRQFDFSNVQKKILMRHVINNDDSDLLTKLIDHNNPVFDLHEYQKDRGITFFHSILIEGSEELNRTLRDNYVLRSVNDVVKFVPVLVGEEVGKRDDAAAAADPLYWDPADDLFNVVTKSNTKIRKGWDSLMIAAANQDHQMFDTLLRAGADTTKFTSMSKFVCKSDATCRGLINFRSANPNISFN